jgi:hypothetical protein
MYDIEEALTAVGAGALVQKRIDPLVNELQRRYAPLLSATPAQQWNSTVYNWDARTQLPGGGFITDGGGRPVSNSTYVQTPVTIRNLLSTGAVTGYAEAVTATFGSLRGREIMGAIKGLNWDVENALLWGNSGCSQFGPYPQFDGLDVQCQTFSGSAQNAIDMSSWNSSGTPAGFDLAALDNVIDLVESNIAEGIFSNDWMFVVSTTLDSRIAQILTNQQRFNNPAIEVGAGLLVPSYRNIPIVKSSFLNARNVTMGAVTTATATTGGSIAASTTRKYQVSAVLPRYGETLPCAEVSQATGSGTATNTITLSFTPPTTGFPNTVVQLYKVWESATTGTETLLGYVDGVVGLQGDGITPIVTTSIVDTGVTLVPQNGSTVPSQSPAAYVGTNSSMKPRNSTGEDFYLVSRDPGNIVRPYVRDVQPVPNLAPTVTAPDQLPYALVTDTALAVRMNTFLGRGYNVAVSLGS